MFKTLRQYHQYNKPFFGVNCGSTGFLLNHLQSGDTLPSYEHEVTYVPAPLVPVTITTRDGQTHT
ncbi:MAG: hypothetical protein H6765_08115 [Candidatus Peribacteria bacterium]|nr:MAG: hypothetical protein H6765_08115 [Candidatus Peribacteria bacterium]